MFDKFVHSESAELGLDIKIRGEYDSIFNSLVEYLKEESDKIITKIDADKTTLLRSWEGARVVGLKMQDIVINDSGQQKHVVFSNFRKIQQRWVVEA